MKNCSLLLVYIKYKAKNLSSIVSSHCHVNGEEMHNGQSLYNKGAFKSLSVFKPTKVQRDIGHPKSTSNVIYSVWKMACIIFVCSCYYLAIIYSF